MVWDRIRQIKAAEPARGEVQMHVFAHSALWPDAKAIADQKTADHKLRVNRGASGVGL